MAKGRKRKKTTKRQSRKDRKARTLQSSWRKATGCTGTMSMAEARELIENTPLCPYCGKKIEWQKLSVDHKVPLSRGGSCDPENLVWCDKRCNMMKGSLTDDEFSTLLGLLDFSQVVKKYVEMKLVAGGFAFSK